VVSTEASLRRELLNAGFTNRAIDAVWPEWWSSDAEVSLSATAELRYTVARRLGISPRSLFEGPPKFIWGNEAKFKNLGTTTPTEQLILTSFGIAAGRALITAAPPALASLPTAAAELRRQILQSSPYVRLGELLVACWGLGIPVAKTNIFPLEQKRMQAMTVRLDGRYAILIGRNSTFPAWIAFILAHELGHIACGHITDSAALLEMDDPLQIAERDNEELQADAFALALLTGDEQPEIISDAERYSAQQVAGAVVHAAADKRIDPGVLALCLAYSTGRWAESIGALKMIDRQEF
jgi:IrrE N-terminal-like domain